MTTLRHRRAGRVSRPRGTNSVTRTTLPNGLRVVLVPMEHARAVAIEFAMAGGPAYETPAAHGVTHAIEHMCFRSTRTRSTEELAHALDAVAVHNAETSTETVTFYLTTLPDALEDALGVLGEALTAPAFDARDWALERGVIENEVADNEDDEDAPFMALFKGSRLAWPILGSVRSLRRLSVGDLRRYHARYMAGRNAVLVIAGRFDDARAMRAVRRAFGGLRAGRRLRPARPSFTQSTPRLRVTEGDDADRTRLVFLFRSLGHRDARARAVEVLALVLDSPGSISGLGDHPKAAKHDRLKTGQRS